MKNIPDATLELITNLVRLSTLKIATKSSTITSQSNRSPKEDDD